VRAQQKNAAKAKWIEGSHLPVMNLLGRSKPSGESMAKFWNSPKEAASCFGHNRTGEVKRDWKSTFNCARVWRVFFWRREIEVTCEFAIRACSHSR